MQPGDAGGSVWPYVAFTGVVFGLGGLVAKGLIDDGVDAFVVTWMPFLVGGVLALGDGARRRALSVAALGPAVVLGVLASAAPALLFNIGFEDLPAGIVTLLISLGPVFTAVIAHFVFADERFTTVKAIGLALAIVGVAVLAGGSLSADDGSSVGALVAVIVGALAAGTGAVVARRVAVDHGAFAVIGPQIATAGVVALALALVLGRAGAPTDGWARWHLPTLAAFGVTTWLGFLSMLRANEIGTTGQVSVIGYFVPLFGVVGGIIVFDDPVTWSLLLGGALIIVAMMAIARGSSTPPVHDDDAAR